MTDTDLEAVLLITAFLLVFFGTVITSWTRNQKPVQMFDEITNLVEYVGGPLDGQTGHPWDQSDYIFRISQCPERAMDGIGALYKREEGTKCPVKYYFYGYGQRHSVAGDVQEV
jgi:hypothetical protein